MTLYQRPIGVLVLVFWLMVQALVALALAYEIRGTASLAIGVVGVLHVALAAGLFRPFNLAWEAAKSFRVQIAVDSWDRPRLLEDVARTFAEHGANIVSYGGLVEDQLAKNWYTAEVGDLKSLRTLLTALRNLEAVFDAYRVTPS